MKDKTTKSHTPGPWEVRDSDMGDNSLPLEVYAPHLDTPEARGSSPMIAAIHYRRPEGEQEANARLFAAAPLLLDALQGMVNQVNYMLELNDGEIVGYSDTSSFSAMAHSRRAIVEATGGAA